jgi:hypothetical protein
VEPQVGQQTLTAKHWLDMPSEEKRISLDGGISAAASTRRAKASFEKETDSAGVREARPVVSDVSAVMVAVGVRTGVGVTVAEMTMVVVRPGVAVMTTVMVMVSGVDVGVGVGV